MNFFDNKKELLEHVKHIALYLYLRNNSADDVWIEISKIYGNGVVSRSTIFRWFIEYEKGNSNIKHGDEKGNSNIKHFVAKVMHQPNTFLY